MQDWGEKGPPHFMTRRKEKYERPWRGFPPGDV